MRPMLPAICLVAITLTSPAVAGGIDFANMPVGCSWTVRYYDGVVWVQTYIGKKNDAHVTEMREGHANGPFVGRKFHNSDGYLTERVWASGNWARFEPYSCYGDLGSCSYVFTNSKGEREVVQMETTKNGDIYTAKAESSVDKFYYDETFTIGRYGIVVTMDRENESYRVTDFMNCDFPSS